MTTSSVKKRQTPAQGKRRAPARKVQPTSSNFLALEPEHSGYETSGIVILPAPLEQTVSYGGGTKLGPKGILDASAYVEFYDDEFDRELCFDVGIATLPALTFGSKKGKAAVDVICDAVRAVRKDGKFCVTLGGEHTLSTGPIRAHYEDFPDMSILHFDAHSDLRDRYQGTPWSHACFMARVAEFFPPEHITQVGIRAQCREEAEFIKEKGISTFYASAIRRGRHGKNWQKSVVSTLKKDVYITFDVDYFDPSLMPATGTPEPDGFFYAETLDLFRMLLKKGHRIVGFDVVELAPMKGLSHPDLTTARLIYKLLAMAFVSS
ncbi:MAG: agmatinase [Candidatus Kapaibacterium sp.]